MSAESIWSALPVVVLTAVRSVLHAGTLAAAGVFMGRTGFMTKEATKAMSTLSMRVTIPALLFTSVLPSVNLKLLYRVWPMLLLPTVYAGLGAAIGYVVIRLCKPPDDFKRGTVAAIAFGNSTGMPIVLLSVISTQLRDWFIRSNGLDSPDAHPPDVPAQPIVFLSVYLLVYPVVQWGVGSWLLAPRTPEEQAADRLFSQSSRSQMRANPSYLDALAAGERIPSTSNLSGASDPQAGFSGGGPTGLAKPLLGGSEVEGGAESGQAESGQAESGGLAARYWRLLCLHLSRLLAVAAIVRKQVLVPPVVAVRLSASRARLSTEPSPSPSPSPSRATLIVSPTATLSRCSWASSARRSTPATISSVEGRTASGCRLTSARATTPSLAGSPER
jgi:predicted permease